MAANSDGQEWKSESHLFVGVKVKQENGKMLTKMRVCKTHIF